jgi:hypothetical protein
VAIDEYVAAAAEQVPADYVEFLTYLFRDVLGNNAYVTDGVQRALGREPRDFSAYARETAASGVWNSSAVNRVRR